MALYARIAKPPTFTGSNGSTKGGISAYAINVYVSTVFCAGKWVATLVPLQEGTLRWLSQGA